MTILAESGTLPRRYLSIVILESAGDALTLRLPERDRADEGLSRRASVVRVDGDGDGARILWLLAVDLLEVLPERCDAPSATARAPLTQIGPRRTSLFGSFCSSRSCRLGPLDP